MLQCSALDTLARIRAKLLHILYVMGREDHQFRIRFKGQYLRDAYTLDDYRIADRCILKMVPMAKRQEVSASIYYIVEIDVLAINATLSGGHRLACRQTSYLVTAHHFTYLHQKFLSANIPFTVRATTHSALISINVVCTFQQGDEEWTLIFMFNLNIRQGL